MRLRTRLLLVSGGVALAGSLLVAHEVYRLPSVDELPRRVAARMSAGRTATWVPLWAISTRLQTAVVVWEDPAFYHHSGVSFEGIRRALVEDLRSAAYKRGGSTITQQLAKNLFLTTDKTLRRKFDEAILAWRLERRFEKNQLLEIYLNTADWGDSDSGEPIVGAEAAAHHYLHKNARGMSWAEAALLAGILPNPHHNDPYADPVSAKILRDRLLVKLQEAENLTKEELDQALATPVLANMQSSQ